MAWVAQPGVLGLQQGAALRAVVHRTNKRRDFMLEAHRINPLRKLNEKIEIR
jgi:hypothetical protein